MIENNETEKKSGVSAIVIGIGVLLCCICLLVAGIAGYGYYAFTQIAPTITSSNPIFPIETTEPASPPEIFRPHGGIRSRTKHLKPCHSPLCRKMMFMNLPAVCRASATFPRPSPRRPRL